MNDNVKTLRQLEVEMIQAKDLMDLSGPNLTPIGDVFEKAFQRWRERRQLPVTPFAAYSLVDALHRNGTLPENTQRAIIDIDVNGVVTLHVQLVADERILDVLLDPRVKIANSPRTGAPLGDDEGAR